MKQAQKCKDNILLWLLKSKVELCLYICVFLNLYCYNDRACT